MTDKKFTTPKKNKSKSAVTSTKKSPKSKLKLQKDQEARKHQAPIQPVVTHTISDDSSEDDGYRLAHH